jgi:CRP-like cAMP-binding protein
MQTPSTEQLNLFRTELLRFVEFSDAEWELFAQHLGYRLMRKKALFVRAGEVCTEIGFILNGSVRFFFTKDGTEISSYFCFKTDLITSYGSFLKKEPSAISIETLEDTEIIYFSCAALQEMLQDERLVFKLEHMGRLIAEYLICCYEERMLSFLTQTPEERYSHLLKGAAGLLQRIPQHHIAAYLGVTPVSLSRIRRRIMSAG